MSCEEDRRLFLDRILLDVPKQPSQERWVKVVLKFLEREDEVQFLLAFDVRNDQQVEQDQEKGLEAASRLAQGNEALVLLAEIDLPVIVRCALCSFFVVFLCLDFGEPAVRPEYSFRARKSSRWMTSRESSSLEVVMYRRTMFEAPRPSGASESRLVGGSVAMSRSAKSRRNTLPVSRCVFFETTLLILSTLALVDRSLNGEPGLKPSRNVRSRMPPLLSVSHVTLASTKFSVVSPVVYAVQFAASEVGGEFGL